MGDVVTPERVITGPLTAGVVDENLAQLQSDDVRACLRAIGNLARAGDPRAVAPLGLLLLRNGDPDVRARAAHALGQIGFREAVDALVQALDDDVAEVRRRAVQALGKMPDTASVHKLVAALADADRDVRRWAARALGSVGDPVAVEALQRLSADTSVVVQDEAARAIRAIHDRQSLRSQRTMVEELRQQRSRADRLDTMAQAQLERQIDLEQLKIYRLEGQIAANEMEPPAVESGGEQDRQRQSIIYDLQRLIRELESVSASVRATRLREDWSNHLCEAKDVLGAWKRGEAELNPTDMQAEFQRLRKRADDRYNTQNTELIELCRFVQEGYSYQLQTERLLDMVVDPMYRGKVESWLRAMEAEYSLLKNAREHGDFLQAKDHYNNLVSLNNKAEELHKQENTARSRSGLLVLLFLLISIVSLAYTLFQLSLNDLSDEKMPSLGVPFAVIIWSAIGSIAAMLYQFLNRPVSQLETFKWLIARPIQGVIMGSFLYILVAAGLIVFGNPATVSGEQPGYVRPELAGIIAFLGGFSDRFTEGMVRRATSILSREPEPAAEKAAG